ncbi:MAG: hypothetical protein AAFY14_06730 [Pseudomonadota bacterium]
MRGLLALILSGTCSIAHAGCGAGLAPFLTCEVGVKRKALSVCYNDEIVTYRFGPADAPELVLTETVENIDFTPWPGAGRAIWEEVRFHNGAYTYAVFAGFDRLYGNTEDTDLATPFFGSVVVTRAGEMLADLQCNRETTHAPWSGLFDAKRAAGQTWDRDAQIWRPVE